MKILHVDTGRPLDGGARQLSLLLNGVDKLPGEHALACPSGAEVIGEITNSSVKIHRLKAAEEKGRGLTSALRKLIRREKPDLLHIHGRPTDAAAMWATILEKRQMVYTHRSDRPLDLVDRYVKFPRFAKIIVPWPSLRKPFTDVGMPAERIVCIPGAVDATRFRPNRANHEQFRAEFGLRGAGPVLAMVASLKRHKGHGVFFGSLPAVLGKYPTMRAVVFGRGTPKERDALQRELARREMEQYVRLEGFRPDMENILPHLDLLIHPAFEEGLGVTLMEAAACGVPVIASRVGGIPDIVQDRFTGYLIKPGDSINLARHIIALLDDRDQMQHFSRTARERALEAFSIEKMLLGHRDLYRYI